MKKIAIFSVGKHKESWLEAGLSEYEKRLKSDVKISWHLFKKDILLESHILSLPFFTLLDPQGIELSSEEFSSHLTNKQQHNFVIGGAEGVSQKIKENASLTLAFSKMVFTHQHCRLILLEQIYRGIAISKNSGYHK